jgi:hypothetical protein
MMRGVCIRGAASILLATGVLGSRQELAQQPFRAGVEAVSIDVSVLKGRTPVAGLGVDAFEVRDNGVLQHVEALSIATVPVDVTLVVDSGGGAGFVPGHYQDVVRDAVHALRAQDRVRVLQFAADVREIVPMQAASAVSIGDFHLIAGRSFTLADAIVTALLAPPAPDRRRLVVAFTNGDENLSLVDPALLPALAGRSDVVFDLIFPHQRDPFQLPGPHMFEQAAATRLRFLPEASAATGGTTYFLDQGRDFAAVFRDVFDEFRHGYVLRYTATGVTRTGWHDVQVRVVAPGSNRYTVRARRGYVGG